MLFQLMPLFAHSVECTIVAVPSGTLRGQGLFVKFVTSVSKPPLLGFQYLRPPFTIRYVPVDVDEKEDEGFSFKHLFLGPTQKTARLPTAATCFNTLKVIQPHPRRVNPVCGGFRS